MPGAKTFSPLMGWISLSVLDGVGRIGLKMVATVLFARWLTPEIFGQAALTIVIVAVLAIFVTAPFEEALTQRKVVSSRHFASSLLIVLCLAAGICLLVMTGCWSLELGGAETPLLAGLVAAFSLILFAQGPISIYTALARRHRGFKRLALCNLSGDLAGTVVGLTLAFYGVGVWSLLAVRLVSRFVMLFSLVAASHVRIVPGFSASHLRDLSAFAGWFFSGRLLETVSDAVFQGLVAKFFGLAGAGYLNMALRIVEPLAGLTGSTGHNIAMSFFVRAQSAPEKLRASIEQTIASTSLLLLPLFIGLAASGPTIIAVLAGPEWQESGPLVVCLALAAALVTSTNFLQGAFSAKGRADLGFFVTALQFVLLVTALTALSTWGLITVGFARLISFAGEATFNIVAARTVLGVSARRTLMIIAPPFLSAGFMGILVAFGAVAMASIGVPATPRLGLEVAGGVIVYLLLISVFHRAGLRLIYQRLRANRTPETGQ